MRWRQYLRDICQTPVCVCLQFVPVFASGATASRGVDVEQLLRWNYSTRHVSKALQDNTRKLQSMLSRALVATYKSNDKAWFLMRMYRWTASIIWRVYYLLRKHGRDALLQEGIDLSPSGPFAEVLAYISPVHGDIAVPTEPDQETVTLQELQDAFPNAAERDRIFDKLTVAQKSTMVMTAEQWGQLTNGRLQSVCKHKKLTKYGKKALLVARIVIAGSVAGVAPTFKEALRSSFLAASHMELLKGQKARKATTLGHQTEEPCRHGAPDHIGHGLLLSHVDDTVRAVARILEQVPCALFYSRDYPTVAATPDWIIKGCILRFTDVGQIVGILAKIKCYQEGNSEDDNYSEDGMASVCQFKAPAECKALVAGELSTVIGADGLMNG
jgi:hypothetical protein